IRQLRLMCGLNQIEFAKRVGIANGSVSKLENGRMALTDELIVAIAQVVDCSPEFLQIGLPTVPTSRPMLRAYADAPKRAVDQQMAHCTTVAEIVEILQLRTIADTIPPFDGDPLDDHAIDRFALEVRAAAQLDEGDVVGNCIRAAERLGCIVLPMNDVLGRHLGLSTRANLAPFICVSRPSFDPGRHVPGDRQRFTVAHEIGHLAMHSGTGPPQTSEEARRVERQANLFASAFLAPGDAVIEDLREYGGRVTLKTLARIKEHWGIAIKALVMRFQSLNVIDQHQARSLYKQISARGWNKEEPVTVGNEEAVWLTRAVQQWSSGGQDWLQEAADASGIGRSYIERWTKWSPTGQSGEVGQLVDLTGRARRTPHPSTNELGTVRSLPAHRPDC
ncbi:ImmA/IrrE family metallo-endopeptidase, partial [Candidatus Poribacteria bacterium]|nr:ImmA/IrrE family metallo-endopeptidase [Candidatus Poribacteria bacterium]